MTSTRIIVTGLIGSIPLAGLYYHYLQYPLGLRELGFDVLYLEDCGSWYYDPTTDSMHDRVSVAVNDLDRVMNDFGMTDCWTFIDHLGQAHGVTGDRLEDFISTASLLINVTGAGIIRDDYLAIPRRAFVDTDPGFLQFRLANGSPQDLNHLRRHNCFFSFGCNIGNPCCRIPTSGFHWQPTVQPIVMGLWPVVTEMLREDRSFTTVAKWKTYDPVEFDGEKFGLKEQEFPEFLDLPQHTRASLEMASAGVPPIDDLLQYGWKLTDAAQVTASTSVYQDYIRRSLGEWSVAKGAYVRTGSGWFSERSACYLASGRPVVVQDTGFGDWLHADAGVLPFRTSAEAAQRLESVLADYQRHCIAAREIAEQYFDSSVVLSKLVSQAMTT